MRHTRHLLSLSLLIAAGSWCRGEGLKERAVLPVGEPAARCLAFSPDGKILATGGQTIDRQANRATGEIKLWDVEAGKERDVLRGHAGGIAAIAFGPDGKTLATAAGDRTIKLWDLEASKETLSVQTAGPGVVCLAFSPDGKTLGYVGYDEVKLLDTATGKEMATFKRSGRGGPGVFSNDLKSLAAASHQDANLYDTTVGAERLVLEDHRGSVGRLAFSADGKTLAVSSTRSVYPKYVGEIKLWDPATGRAIALFKDRINVVRALTVNPDGKLLAVAGSKELTGPNDLKLIDVATGRDLAVMEATRTADWMWCLAFSPDGRFLAGGTGKTVTLWEVPSAVGR